VASNEYDMEAKLVYEGTKSLNGPSTAYEIDADTQDLVKEMIKVMVLHNGIGLAAPQIGINKRLFVIGSKDTDFIACINPEWEPIEDSDQRLFDEGCLSFPGLFLKVKRYKRIKVSYTTMTGEQKTRELSGVWSQAFQHEYDHLDGITFDKKVSKIKLNMAQKKREKMYK